MQSDSLVTGTLDAVRPEGPSRGAFQGIFGGDDILHDIFEGKINDDSEIEQTYLASYAESDSDIDPEFRCRTHKVTSGFDVFLKLVSMHY